MPSEDSMRTLSSRMDTQRAHTQILQAQIEEGLQTIDRPTSGQFLSGLSCGLDIGFGPFMMAAMYAVTAGTMVAAGTKILMSLMYTLGFMFVILGQSELFTEHTTLAVLPILEGERSLRDLGGLWGTVWVGNTIGGVVVALGAAYVGPALNLVPPSAFRHLGNTFIGLPVGGVFGGAVLAGWLMGLLSWILTAAGDTISRIAVIVATTFVIGFGHLPHCVAGNIEVLAAMFSGASISVVEWARFLSITTAGNALGGVVFVSLLKHAHVRRGGPETTFEIEQKEGVGVERS
ncbi:formate/nitrite transporter family protein [Halobacterium zhouii]|uniref:formate/nitrite transporter family protein n=1 Tax=Halobacterium zhouii TaxID=2902624 RepID=UPI001E41D1C6|nr:formate/nitrite transporter family protein [Halobacterium zhouii]